MVQKILQHSNASTRFIPEFKKKKTTVIFTKFTLENILTFLRISSRCFALILSPILSPIVTSRRFHADRPGANPQRFIPEFWKQSFRNFYKIPYNNSYADIFHLFLEFSLGFIFKIHPCKITLRNCPKNPSQFFDEIYDKLFQEFLDKHDRGLLIKFLQKFLTAFLEHLIMLLLLRLKISLIFFSN